MIRIHDLIWLGDQKDCEKFAKDYPTVHACKYPCHRELLGYNGHLDDSSPHYLAYMTRGDCYLNIIDSGKPLYPIALFRKFYKWAAPQIRNESEILIHCNQGRSRSPTLALLLLAKELKEISNESFQQAQTDFLKIYPEYLPARGLTMVLDVRWKSLEIPENAEEEAD